MKSRFSRPRVEGGCYQCTILSLFLSLTQLICPKAESLVGERKRKSKPSRESLSGCEEDAGLQPEPASTWCQETRQLKEARESKLCNLQEAEGKATSEGNNRFIAKVIWKVRDATSCRFQDLPKQSPLEGPGFISPFWVFCYINKSEEFYESRGSICSHQGQSLVIQLMSFQVFTFRKLS